MSSPRSIRPRGLALAAVLILPAPLAARANWPQFRGPGARGVATAPGLPDRWSATENVAWKTDLPGRGWSSPVVWGDRVFLTSVVSRKEPEPARKGLYFGGDRATPPGDVHDWKVLCASLTTGKVEWERTVHSAAPRTSRHIKNSYASETPVTDGQRLYVTFGNLGVYCLDVKGKLLWTRPLTPHRTRADWGTAASPVLAPLRRPDRLILVDDNEEDSSIQALDLKSGKRLWTVARDEKSNWSTPFIWEHPGRTEIVTAGSGKVRSYDLDGKLLWWLEGMSSITISTPYAANGLLYLSSGYVGSPLRPLYAIRPGGSGNLSIDRNERSGPFVAWCDWRGAPYNPSTVVDGSRLFVLFDFGFLAGYDAATGRPLFERQRIPDGRHFTSSPWAANGKIFCLNEDGKTFVYRSGDACELLHVNPLAEDDMCMATPALAGDHLLIRTSARLYCIRERRP